MRGVYLISGPDFRNLTLCTFGGYIVHFSCQAACFPPHTPSSHSTLLLIPSKSPCLELRHHLRLDALPEARRRHVLLVLLLVATANPALTNELQQEHLRLDALHESRRRHVPVKTAYQTLTIELRLHLVRLNPLPQVRLNPLPQARRRHVLLVLVTTTANQMLLTDQGRRTIKRDSMQRSHRQQVARNLQTIQKMKTS